MHQDFSELLAEFNAHNVEYLVVGAHALAAHGVVRAVLSDSRGIAEKKRFIKI